MILKNLRIELKDWGSQRGQYVGTAEFTSPIGEVEVRLTPEHVKQIFAVCAESIVTVAKEVSSMMTSQVIDQAEAAKLIETQGD
jgi:hypothetical protein